MCTCVLPDCLLRAEQGLRSRAEQGLRSRAACVCFFAQDDGLTAEARVAAVGK